MEKLFDHQFLLNIWNERLDLTLLQAILLGLFFAAANFGCFVLEWYWRRSEILEYTLSKTKKRSLRKRMEKYTITNDFFLVGLLKEAKTPGLYLRFKQALHWLTIFACGVSVVGLVATLVTKGQGWALALLIFPVYGFTILAFLLSWIPDMICLPSERRRYF